MRTRINQNKEEVFCDWRRKWVRLTPEEWVRQQLLHRLVEQLGYPASLIAVEVPLEKISNLKSPISNFQSPILPLRGSGGSPILPHLRCDAVVYDTSMQPLMLIECKAETVPLTQKTLDQALTYNRRLSVPYLLLHNGPQSIIVRVLSDSITLCPNIPDYACLSANK